jgi:Homeodomain-like domain
MDDTPCRRFFLEPVQPLHRRFAALHAFFVEGLSTQAIGERFGLSYHTVRSWVRDFRCQCRVGQIPPFLSNRISGDRLARPRSNPHGRKNRLRPTAANLVSRRGGVCGPASRACSCSCRY